MQKKRHMWHVKHFEIAIETKNVNESHLNYLAAWVLFCTYDDLTKIRAEKYFKTNK